MIFDSVKTKEQAAEIRDAVGGVGWENVASVRGYARYLCHLDNPEKARYNTEDIIELGGADYKELSRRAADSTVILRDMMSFIRDNGMIYYCDFVDYCMSNEPDWFDDLMSRHTYVIYSYIKSISHKLDDEMKGATRQ